MTEEFELRHADAGQEFTYTTSERVKVDPDEEPPAGASLTVEPDPDDPDAPPTVWATREGVSRTIRADETGIVTPKNADDVRVLDQFGIPRARKAMAERKAADKPTDAPAPEAPKEG